MKDILIYFPDTIFPLSMGNRVRVIEKVKALSQHNSVTFLSIVETEKQKEETNRILGSYCRCEFVFRPGKKSLYGVLLRSKWKMFDYLGILPHDYIITNGQWLKRALRKIFKDHRSFDSVVCDYWYGAAAMSGFFNGSLSTLVVDTHNILSDQRELEVTRFRDKLSTRQWLKKYRQLEKANLAHADVLLAISKIDFLYYQENYPGTKIALLPSGIDLCKFKDVRLNPSGNIILFYGNLGDDQNIIAFERLWQKIFPEIKREIPDLRLLVVGSNPTEEMLKLNKLDYVKVTGFVENPFELICKAKIHIIAMETGSGFRGRIPEVMGLGIPTIGTHNALDCVGLDGELEKLITDDDREIAGAAIHLLKDNEYWNRISGLSKEFISENYSLQKTYKKLENYL